MLLEELLAAGHSGAEYDAWLINIGEGDQFSSGYVAINPNSKIPVMVDRSGTDPIRIFESGAILIHLAEKFGAFMPTDTAKRAETLSWLMWQMGSAPFLGGGFGHFYAYAPFKQEYPINRYAMEVKRQLDVLDRRLAESEFIAGADYTIADMAIWPWYGALVKGLVYEAGEFLQVQEYQNVQRWTDQLATRPGREARSHGQSRGRRSREPASRAPRCLRLRSAHAGQAGGGGRRRITDFSQPDRCLDRDDQAAVGCYAAWRVAAGSLKPATAFDVGAAGAERIEIPVFSDDDRAIISIVGVAKARGVEMAHGRRGSAPASSHAPFVIDPSRIFFLFGGAGQAAEAGAV